MGTTGIEGVLVTKARRISNPKGDIFHGMKRSDPGFCDFGEAYFTFVNSGEIKGWNRHRRMTLNLLVPMGAVAFVVYDGREKSVTGGRFCTVEASVDNYIRLTIPPGVWLAFKGNSAGPNLILNIADLEHDPDEVEKFNLDDISYNWTFL